MSEVCAQCKNESQFTATITKLLTSTCGHSFCNICIDRYINKREYSCPICGAQVRMQDLSEETADEREIKRIREARKKVFAIFDPSKLLTTSKYDIKTQDRCIKREEFFVGKYLDWSTTNEQMNRYEAMNSDYISENKTSQKKYEAQLEKEISEEQKLRRKKNEEYLNGKAGRKMREIKKQKREFYSFDNCKHIRPKLFIKPRDRKKGISPVVIKSIYVPYILKRSMNELLCTVK